VEHLIEVAFKGNRREFFRWSFEAPPPVKAPIIVEVERGEDLGRVHATGELAERRKAGTTHGKEQREPLRAALRLATADDAARADALRVDEETARRVAVQKARALNLQMKVSDAEWQWDRRRLTFYFTAEERVDFRALVRQLEGHFGARVQMWHIGPRDEAKRLDGVGHCGRQLCSAAWLPELLPVKTSLAKEQRLSTITPTQISGACGRLMCCLRYEHEFYVQARKRFPKQGKVVQTAEGEEKVEHTDIFRDLVTLRNPTGELRTIPLSQFKRELGGIVVPVDDEPNESDDESEQAEERAANVQEPRRAGAGRAEPRADAPPQARPASREGGRRDRRGEPFGAPRGEARTETRPDPRPARPEAPRGPEARPDAPPRAAAPPHADSPPRPEHPQGADRGAPAAPPGRTAPSTPHNESPAHAGGEPSDSADADARRARRRRGRRGGRRHRGDRPPGAPGGSPNGGGPSGPPPATPNH
jgi:cell fate regulator YaaT (PSP1 superfamily)